MKLLYFSLKDFYSLKQELLTLLLFFCEVSLYFKVFAPLFCQLKLHTIIILKEIKANEAIKAPPTAPNSSDRTATLHFGCQHLSHFKILLDRCHTDLRPIRIHNTSIRA